LNFVPLGVGVGQRVGGERTHRRRRVGTVSGVVFV
jgi:hypothetical protein